MRAPGIIRFLLLCAVSLGIAAGAGQLLGTAFAAAADGRGVEAFSRAVKAYDDGDWNAAAGHVDEAMQAGLPKDLTARAIHLRAHINEHSGAFARALQDYSTALWMDTLPQGERKVAQEGKQRVIAAMGLNSSQPGGAQASMAPEPAPQSSSGGGWSMFGVFGSSKPAPPPPAPPPAPAAAEAQAPEPAAPRAATSASGVLTRPKPAEARSAKAAPAPAPTVRAALAAKARPPAPVRIASLQPAATPISTTAGAGGFMILFGSAGSEAAGQSKAHQIKTVLADILVNRQLEVEAGAAGGYQIVAGPYKVKSSALAVCSAIKQRGVSCQVTP